MHEGIFILHSVFRSLECNTDRFSKNAYKLVVKCKKNTSLYDHPYKINKLNEGQEPQFSRGANFGYSKVQPKVILGPGTEINEVLII